MSTSTITRGNVFHVNPIEMICLFDKVDNSQLWKKRFVSNTFVVRDFSKIVKPTNTICKDLILGNQNKNLFPRKTFTTSTKLQIIHTNLCSPTSTRYFYRETYFMLLIDDFTRMMWISHEAFEKIKIFDNRVETKSSLEIKCLRYDRASLVSWLRKKQDCISPSIEKVEYVAATKNCNHIICMKHMLKNIGLDSIEHDIIHCNRTCSIFI